MSAVQMGSYFTDQFEAIAGLPAAIAQAPIVFLIAFTIVGILTCIYFHADQLERRRVLHRRQFIQFSDIESVAPHGKSFAAGVVIHAASGDKMRILASYSGYSELLTRLGEFDPKPKAMASFMATRKVRNARTSRG